MYYLLIINLFPQRNLMNSMQKIAIFSLLILASQTTHSIFADDIITLQEKQDYITAKRNLRACFFENRNGVRNSRNYPTACQDLLLTLALIAELKEVNEIIQAFAENSTPRNHNPE
jgi:hypothetical protein